MTRESSTTPTDAELQEPDAGHGTAPVESLTDPGSLRGDVPFHEETSVHDDRDHCAVGADGRAVVGVTDDDGAVLLAVHGDASVAILPNGRVEPGEDWVAVGRRAVEETTGVTAEIDGPELVRDFDHVVDGDERPHTTSYNVVFRASPEAGADDPGVPGNDVWDAGWFEELPADLTVDEGPLVDDIRLFLD